MLKQRQSNPEVALAAVSLIELPRRNRRNMWVAVPNIQH